MKIYALTDMYNDFLGIETGNGKMLDLTRAISFFEIALNNVSEQPVEYIDHLMLTGMLDRDYLEEVLSSVHKYGLEEEFTLKDENEYEIGVPIYPGKIIALGNNYRDHIREMNQALPDEPVLFGKWPSCVIGHREPIIKPTWIGRMDYEAELAVVIGSYAYRVSPEQAMDYVAGYTCLNDVSARDIQKKDLARSLPWMPSKNFDTFAPLGPCLLIAEAVDDPVSIQVQSRVNGELKQNGNTSDFIFDIPTVIAYITNMMTLEPGDIITTGTPMGVGPIEPGDIVEITCEGIGTLSNPVISEEEMKSEGEEDFNE